MDADLADLSAQVGATLTRLGLTLASAESCTGGWVAQVVTHSAGSSVWFERGFITYSNAAKITMLGVSPDILDHKGAVSPETAGAMAAGALKNSNALISLSITGIAGPTGGSPGKPVGTVCFGWCLRGAEPETATCRFEGDREAVRRQSVIHALNGLLSRARTMP
jgi:nicotinamide-nucleotide amidase